MIDFVDRENLNDLCSNDDAIFDSINVETKRRRLKRLTKELLTKNKKKTTKKKKKLFKKHRDLCDCQSDFDIVHIVHIELRDF